MSTLKKSLLALASATAIAGLVASVPLASVAQAANPCAQKANPCAKKAGKHHVKKHKHANPCAANPCMKRY